jgi:hypothetical protein
MLHPRADQRYAAIIDRLRPKISSWRAVFCIKYTASHQNWDGQELLMQVTSRVVLR